MAKMRTRSSWLVLAEDDRVRLSGAELVRRSQCNLDAFVELYHRYVDAVFRYCNRRLPTDAAEDATSITFLNGLDVFEQEPTPSDNPLLGLENVFATPQVGGGAAELEERQVAGTLENIELVVTGASPERFGEPWSLALGQRKSDASTLVAV